MHPGEEPFDPDIKNPDPMQMPVCQEVYRVLNSEIPASEAYRGLRIQAGHEREPG